MDQAVEQVVAASTPHELIVTWLERECGFSPEQYDALYLRMLEWAGTYSNNVAVNEFNPIMLLEQLRREFDPAVGLVEFSMVAADLQWGPRMMKVGQFEHPVWIVALQGFPTLIAQAREKVGITDGK